jgi:membrane-associated phospholipid phosphatase
MTNYKTSTYLLMEKVTFVYMLVLSLLILVFHANLTNDLTGSPYHWATYIGFNLGVCLVIVFLANGLNHNTNRWILFFRHFYFLLFFILFYEETRYLVHLVHPGFFDSLINRLELRVFGIYPTVWMQKSICFGLNEFLMFSYVSYYLLLVVLGLGLFFSRKVKEFDDLLFTASVAFYISYLGFIFFPVAGPRFALVSSHQVGISGGFFTSLAKGVIDVAGIQGGAMPSSHVAVALVVLVYARRHHRLLCYILSPMIISLFAATVYGRFHYVSDVAAGLLVGGVSIFICDRAIRKRKADGMRVAVKKEFSLDLARVD